jgi:hypothetical protein
MYFRTLIPDLWKHFETLEISADLFLIEWLLTLFSRGIMEGGNIDLISRIWDNFLLDGEFFALKTSLAILKYHESELMNQSYYKIIKILRGTSNRRNSQKSAAWKDSEESYGLHKGINED